jgi:hypothetical protein
MSDNPMNKAEEPSKAATETRALRESDQKKPRDQMFKRGQALTLDRLITCQ